MEKFNRQEETVVGLDVHKDTIVAAVLPPHAERPTTTVTIEHTPDVLAKLVKRLAAKGPVAFVYEAGPCGYAPYRHITALGHPCTVVAPGLIPVRPGDRVKTDRRDAEKLARLYRAGELTSVGVPTGAEEAARDLVRAREDAIQERLQAQHRLGKFLLRQGRVYRTTGGWRCATGQVWLHAQRFEWPALQQTFDGYVRTFHEVEARLATFDQHLLDLAAQPAYQAAVQALSCLKGVKTVNALTLVVELFGWGRFAQPRQLMCYTGLVAREHSSGGRRRQGGITKVGNAHVRRVLVEAAWSYRHPNAVSRELAARRTRGTPAVVAIAHKAQMRLHRTYWRLLQRGKAPQVAVVAVARELAGFVWAILQQVPKEVSA